MCFWSLVRAGSLREVSFVCVRERVVPRKMLLGFGVFCDRGMWWEVC